MNLKTVSNSKPHSVHVLSVRDLQLGRHRHITNLLPEISNRFNHWITPPAVFIILHVDILSLLLADMVHPPRRVKLYLLGFFERAVLSSLNFLLGLFVLAF